VADGTRVRVVDRDAFSLGDTRGRPGGPAFALAGS
jgi:hypothetical protein